MEQTLHNAFKRFSLGDELRAYTFLGCHAAERDGVHGYVFRVWAPRAQGVSVTGDWNFWNTEDLPMTLVEYGIWEAFSAYAREGDAYKFYIRRRDGSAVYKSDPYAFRNCALPDTSSRICTLDGYTWGDADYRRKQGKRKLLNCPMNIYEMHFGSWRRKPDGSLYTYDELADELVPYLKDMGIDIIYLNPIFRARSNHRYDTGDYTQVDPLCGTNTEFTELCEAAKKVGIRVMLDGVFSHTGEDSVYFNHFGHYPTLGAYQGQSSPYYDWYTFNHYPEDYKAWWGILSLPELRKDNPEYQKFMFQPHEGVVPRWIEAGSCGWRLDVADELPVDFLRKLRAAAKAADPEAVVLGEVWEDASNKVAYGETRCYCTGDTLDSVMNYPVREAILNFVMGKTSASTFVRLIHHQEEVYPAQFRYALMNLVGSHDRCRALNILAGRECQELSKADQQHVHLNVEEYELAVRRYKLCIDLLCALPGCATVYYGDEVGLTGCHDPWNRRAFPWGHEDKSLQKYVANKLRHRQESDLLRLGYCDIEAPDDDTLLITRRMKDGHDALGQESTVTGKEIIKVCRKLH